MRWYKSCQLFVQAAIVAPEIFTLLDSILFTKSIAYKGLFNRKVAAS